jgi:phospholipid-binding lipoprotein MlaA
MIQALSHSLHQSLNKSFKPFFTAIEKIAIKAYITTAIAVLCLISAGCASVAVKNPVDPWESWNRGVSLFNDDLDNKFVKPVANAYVNVVPRLVRTGVNNFFFNLTSVWTAVNSTLQLKPRAAAEAFMRFNVNTFLGLGGLLDIASEMNLERHTADFGQTLGHYGVPPGPYLVIPFLGSSTLRDTLASTVISRGDLVWQLNSVPARNSLYAFRLLDIRANLLRSSSVLEGVALDKYTFTRDVYLQVRRNDILDGKEPPEEPSEVPEYKENPPIDDKTKGEPEKKSAIDPKDVDPKELELLPEVAGQKKPEMTNEQSPEVKQKISTVVVSAEVTAEN